MFYNPYLYVALLNLFILINRTSQIPDLISDQRSKPLKSTLLCSERAIGLLSQGQKFVPVTTKWSKPLSQYLSHGQQGGHSSLGGSKDAEKKFPHV